ncbi:MAG: carboxylating nicotinate-nucleotide diphosphorylase [Clostridia bacterium]|jgi:nicotinate-nucleotide pyrophosphorylase (carboxylating)|nr:carboxylating nicotinate-nucleotide diphosphorylase [Clostridiaceae bacterium]
MILNPMYIDEIIHRALKEDMPYGDITTDHLIDGNQKSNARLIGKESGVIAGMDVAKRVFELLDSEIVFESCVKDGDRVQKGDVLAYLSGKTASILKAERTALNLLQRMSGIATATSLYVEEVKGCSVRIVDTRKTVPGLRMLDKYAVTAGGGHNHRYGLSDAVLIKDNHIAAAGGIKNAISIIRSKIPHTVKIEVETENFEQVMEAIEAKADIIMLDNMDCKEMKRCVDFINRRALVEASGNVSLKTVREIAQTGVDIISVGAITHSVKALDISLLFC